jgi:hypothetical protein
LHATVLTDNCFDWDHQLFLKSFKKNKKVETSAKQKERLPCLRPLLSDWTTVFLNYLKDNKCFA